MEIRSLALQTSLMVHRLSGTVDDRGDYLVLRTPSVPDFWYGNCLALPGPPRQGDLGRWMERFEAELPEYEGGHRVFLVDSPEGDVGDSAPFIEAGFEPSVLDVLATDSPRAPEGLCDRYPIRQVSGDRAWAALAEAIVDINADEPGYDEGYVARKVATIRSAVERGEGAWWAAWDGTVVAGHLGIFWADGLARFQHVETRVEYRRQGICRSVLHAACSAARDWLGNPTFVIVPADDGVRRVYESLGFAYRERTVDYLRPPRSRAEELDGSLAGGDATPKA